MQYFKGLICLVCCLTIFTLNNFAQTTDEDGEIEINTQLVDVPIAVTDAEGKPILNLKRENFIVYEDGKLQQIETFSTTEAPFEVALLLDTSGSTRNDLRLIKRSAQNFINSLRIGDRVSIIAFNKDYETDRKTNIQQEFSVSEVVIELTEDRTKLMNALENVETSNGTPYYDGLVQVAEKVFKNSPSEKYRGRRALVTLTDGVDSTSITDFAEAKELLEEASIVTYFIQLNTRENFESDLLGDCGVGVRFSDAQIKRYYALFGRNSKIEKVYDFCKIGDFTRLDMSKRLYELADLEMQTLAKTSGGKVFPVASLNEARNAFREVANAIGTNYSLGYYPSNDQRDGKFRKIKVELKNLPKGATVRSREGYTAPQN